MQKIYLSILLLLISLSGVYSQWTQSGTNIYNTNTGLVGIGNQNPETLLFVGKNMTEPAITIKNFGGFGGATFEMKDEASGADWKFKATSSGSFKIRDHAGSSDVVIIEQNCTPNLLYLRSGGRIGIGTANPAQQLEISGNFALPVTGIIFSGANPWMHNYSAPETTGKNTFIGINSGNLNLSGSNSGDNGSYNTGVGQNSLPNLSTGKLNTAVGAQALYANTVGNYNTAIGLGALKSNTSGNCNTAIGISTLCQNTTVSGLTAVGSNALSKNTSGSYNTALGDHALFNNTSGYRNTAIGAGAMHSVGSGYSNVAIGVDAMVLSGDSAVTNVAVGNSALSKSNRACNVAVGTAALKELSLGLDCIAMGTGAMLNNSTGNENIGIGVYAMNDKVSGDANTAVGQYILWKNVSGNTNTAIGNRAGYWNTGSGNIFIGDSAAYFETGSDKLYIDNTPTASPLFYGDLAKDSVRINGVLDISENIYLPETSSSSGVVFSGSRRFIHNYGEENVFIGKEAGNLSLEGKKNVAMGDSSLYAIASGDNNIAIGHEALYSMITGNYNIALGSNARCLPDGTNTITIGSNAYANSDNQVRLGNQEITSMYCFGAYNGIVGSNAVDLYVDNTGKIGFLASSARYKSNVSELSEVQWLYDLRPVTFTYNSDPDKKKQYGLIAEEVEQVNSYLVHYNSQGQIETVSYNQLIAPLIKAIQEQQETLELLKQEVEIMKSEREQLLRNQELIMSLLGNLELSPTLISLDE